MTYRWQADHSLTIILRDHSFPWTAEFSAESRNFYIFA